MPIFIKNKEAFFLKHAEEIRRLKEDFFYVYTECGKVKEALSRLDVSYHVYRNFREIDDDFNNIVRAADSCLDDQDEGLLRDVAHGRGPAGFDKVRLTATICLLNNRRYKNPDAGVVMPPEIRRYMIPRPEKESVDVEEEG